MHVSTPHSTPSVVLQSAETLCSSTKIRLVNNPDVLYSYKKYRTIEEVKEEILYSLIFQ